MELTLLRSENSPIDSIGHLYVDSKSFCYTLEDGYHLTKIYGKTRVPVGRRKIILRSAGGMYERYCKRFNEDHKIIWIINIPGFTYIYIHIGNDKDDTEGCILVGDRYVKRDDSSYFLYDSKITYLKLHKLIVDEILIYHRDVYINIIDLKG